MQRVLSTDLWAEVKSHSRKAKVRRAAIAFVTKEVFRFKKGDVLVVNASRKSITYGETDAKLLLRLCRRDVRIYSRSDLHAKVFLFDHVAIVGSANMSSMSLGTWVEAGIVSDNPSIASGVASFIEQLTQGKKPLKSKDLAELCRIKVVRRGKGGRAAPRKKNGPKIGRLGNRTWIVGVKEMSKEPIEREQRLIEEAAKKLEEQDPDDLEWIKWTGNGRFIRECKEGDQLIEVWRKRSSAQPTVVYRSSPVLLKQSTKLWTRFYVKPREGSHSEISWGQFKKLLRKIAYPRKVGPYSTQVLDADVAHLINRNWGK